MSEFGKENDTKGQQYRLFKKFYKSFPKEKGIYIEIKDNREICVIKLVEILKRFSISPDKIRIITFHPNTVQLAKNIYRKLKLTGF